MRAPLLLCLLLLTLVAPIASEWWAGGRHVVLDPRLVCNKSRRARGRLADICRNETSLLREMTRGVSLGSSECQHQFRSRRWNCTSQRRTMRKILMRDTRETGFVNAITAAGVTWAITRACTAGDLVECSCGAGAPAQRRGAVAPVATPAPASDWEWGGCGDNIRFGCRKSRDFMDARFRRRSDIKTMLKLHNNNAGRLAIKGFMKPECKCHGLSGSCTLKTCWLKMPPFREVGNRLKDRFDGAAKVIASNDGKRFMPEGNGIKTPSKQDLVYSDESPDFCRPNHKTGSLGTHGRSCNATSAGVDGCDLLCCGRGYSHRSVKETVNCRCKFRWCCDVTCDTCTGRREIYACL